MSVYFLRHLKTKYNMDGIISGTKDSEIVPGQRIINTQKDFLKIEKVLCSPLKRCKTTISMFYDQKIHIEYMDELSERNMGVLEGTRKEEAKEKYPYLFCGSKLDVDASIPNGESVWDVQKRLAVVIKFLHDSRNKNILICSHNQTMKILFFSLMNIPITNNAWQCLNFPNGVVIDIGNLEQNSTLK